MIRAELVHRPLDLAQVMGEFTSALGPECGAVVAFCGLARATGADGSELDALVLDHHPRLTQRSLEAIATDSTKRFDVAGLAVIHRAGRVVPGDVIVWVAAAAVHRRAAFEAADYLMDRLKTDAIFWKHEESTGGTRWIEATAGDRADRARWEGMTVAGRIDETLPFHPLRIAVLTVSDTRSEADDTSGGTLIERLTSAGHDLAGRVIVADDVDAIRRQVQAWVADEGIDVILSTGGTGFSPRDVTPEAIRPLLQREMEGFAVVFHQASLGTVGLATLQSRAFAGQIGDCFIFCLPGSTGACRDAWDHVLGLQLDSRYRPCSLAGQIPRLRKLAP